MTLTREPVQPTKRRPMTRARRTRIWLRDKGLCGNCGEPVPRRGTTIDHRIPLWLGGADDDGNLRFMCRACDQPKTSEDKGVIAHVKRLIRKADPETRKPPQMRSRPWTPHPTLKRQIGGRVVARKGTA